MKYCEILEKFLDQEKKAAGLHVTAPVLPGGKVRITVGDLVWESTFETQFSGWGVFELLPSRKAHFVREAEEWEKEEYAKGFKTYDFLLIHKDPKGVWWGYHFHENLTAPIYLAQGVSLFDSVTAIEDKGIFYHLSVDQGGDWKKRKILREKLENLTSPEDLWISSLTLKEKEVYRLAYSLNRNNLLSSSEKKILEALRIGGGELQELTQTQNGYRVKWKTTQGETVVSVIDPRLNLISAGICLKGEEKKQDFTSLVSLVSQKNSPRTSFQSPPNLSSNSSPVSSTSSESNRVTASPPYFEPSHSSDHSVSGNAPNPLYSQICGLVASLREELKSSPKDLIEYFKEIKNDLKEIPFKYAELSRIWIKVNRLLSQGNLKPNLSENDPFLKTLQEQEKNTRKKLEEVKTRIENEMVEIAAMLGMLLAQVIQLKIFPRFTSPDLFSSLRDSLGKRREQLEILKELSHSIHE